MNNSKLVHDYAHQVHTSGKGSNLFYEGPTLYSYGHHFPICHLARGKNGDQILFWHDKRYSSTTNKHQALASRATRHINRIDIPANCIDSVIYASEDTTYTALAHAWRNESQRLIKIMGTAGKSFGKRLDAYQSLRRIETNVLKFVRDFLGFNPSHPPVNFGFLPVITEVANDYFKTQYQQDQQAREKRSESSQAAAATRQENSMKAWENRYTNSTPEEIAQWIAGARNTVRPGQYDILRKTGEGVETSQGIKMTIQEAKAIYLQLIAQQLKPGDKVLNHYTVISVNGTVKIGCHTFETDYLLTFGENL